VIAAIAGIARDREIRFDPSGHEDSRFSDQSKLPFALL